MNLFSMWLDALLIALLSCLAECQVNSGQFRRDRNRIIPFDASSFRNFALLDVPADSSLPSRNAPSYAERGSLPKRLPLRFAAFRTSRQGSVGRHGKFEGRGGRRRLGSAALRTREGGAFSIDDQSNNILKYPAASKPTKQPQPNKINIETPVNSGLSVLTSPPTEKVKLRETAILHCTFDSTEQIGAYQQAKIWWTKQPENSGERPVVLAAGTQVRVPDERLRVVTFPDNGFSILIIRNVIREDSGIYKCSLPSIAGTRTTFSRLNVDYSADDMISTSPKENELQEGESLRLFCQPQGSSRQVWWSAKTSQGDNIPLTQGFSRVAGPVLQIASVSKQQEGVYTCHVESSSGQPIKRHFNVQVKEKPWDIGAYQNGLQIEDGVTPKPGLYGREVALRCDTGGVPTPYVQWYRNGQPLINNYKFSSTSYEPSYKANAIVSKLVIKDFQRYDEGNYSCKVYNDIGLKQRQFYLRGEVEPVEEVEDDEDAEPNHRYYNIREGSGDDE